MVNPKFSIGDIIIVSGNHHLIEDFDAARYVCRCLETNIINKIGWWAFDYNPSVQKVA